MARNPLDYLPAHDKVAPPSIVHVERTAGGGVVVRVAYPPGKFRAAVVGTAVTCCLLAAIPMFFLREFARSFPTRASTPLLLALFPAALATPLLILRVSRLAESYTLEADAGGITIRRYRGRREWLERLPREQITDVRLGFGRGKTGLSTAWLIIALKPWHHFNRRLLHDLGGDNLARVADALRSGIGLPPRSWP